MLSSDYIAYGNPRSHTPTSPQSLSTSTETKSVADSTDNYIPTATSEKKPNKPLADQKIEVIQSTIDKKTDLATNQLDETNEVEQVATAEQAKDGQLVTDEKSEVNQPKQVKSKVLAFISGFFKILLCVIFLPPILFFSLLYLILKGVDKVVDLTLNKQTDEDIEVLTNVNNEANAEITSLAEDK